MEILQRFKQNGYFSADVYHLLTKKKIVDTEEVIIPSEYMKEMKLSTQERLQMLHKIEVDNIVTVGPKHPVPGRAILEFTPRLLVFQNFRPNDKIITKFSVKNISKGPTFLNMVYKESSYFVVKPIGGKLLSRLAPGISMTFTVTFEPVQVEDYGHKVTFITDKDQYVLPFLAMAPRPMFDFPDEIVIPEMPLKVENSVKIFVQNIGGVAAGVKLDTKCPFAVQPKSIYLNPNENIELKVIAKSMHQGQLENTLFALLETGEVFKIRLYGKTFPVSVQLEKPVVRFLDTYKTMVRQQTFKLTNKSDHLLTYMCMKNEDVFQDFEDKVKLAHIFYNFKQSESRKCQKLVYYDVLSNEEHDRVYTRIFFDQIQSLVADESLHFQDTHFSITPIKGQLWPNKSTDLTIFFNPQAIGEFQAVAYLDMDGMPERVPLKMVGTSLPPEIVLNLETLDMDRVYISKKYNCEVVAINKGHINGVIEYKDKPTMFGSCVTCTPALRCLRPDERDIFVVSFSNSNQGPFFEEVNFVIRDSDVVLKLYLKGEVIYPSLMFSIPSLDFGIVSVGVPKTLELDVINESTVEVDASIKISSDGPEISSIELKDYALAELPKPEIPQWPREFDIQPSKVNMGPESKLSLKITLTANLVRANQTSLELEIEASNSPPIVLPVTFDARVPMITPAPDINLRACFLDFPYNYEIKIATKDVEGYFTLIEQEAETTLQVTVDNKEGFIESNSTIIFPVTIRTCVLGVQEYTIRINLFGLSKPIDICHITECGLRPIVTCTPTALHWGQVKLLSKSRKSLTLCNDSPVLVRFKAFVLNRDGRWQIHPTEGHIDPEGETDLCLTLYLLDANTYMNKAVIQLERVKEIFIPLSATGVGTSIVVGELRDRVVLGRNFTNIQLKSTVEMENRGSRIHVLEWSEHYKAPKAKPLTAGFFNLEPRLFKMAAGEKIDLTITGVSHKVTTIKETWYLVGSVEGINKKELLLECQIIAEFVEPKLEMSTSLLEFRYDFGPYSEYYKLTEIVTIKNVSKLPLDMDINIKPPFAIIKKKNTYKISPGEEQLCSCICYRESDLDLENIINTADANESKVFIDYLTLKPVQPLRKGRLNFFQDINKIKMAFNLCQHVEERLEDQEVMKLQVLFDTTKHLNLKSKVYSDSMRTQFKGHKNKDAVKIIGKINFPNVLVMSPRVDFQCIMNGSIASKRIKLTNPTPLLVCFQFQWKKSVICKNVMPELPVLNSPCDANTSSFYSELESTAHGKSKLRAIKAGGYRAPVQSQNYTVDNDEAKTIFGSDPCADVSYIEEDSAIHRTRIINKVAPMIASELDVVFPWIWKFRKLSHDVHKTDTNRILRLIPFKGILKPNECQFIHVIFKPTKNINVKAVIDCEVLGGPSEFISITGQSSDLMYNINTHKLNFKIRSFHENATELLVITNTARLVFEYKTYVNEPKFQTELEGTILDLVPPESTLEPEEKIEMKVVMRPGVLGYFNRVFLLEIGHLPHIPIEVFGWGVIPQVYISLPRPDIMNLRTEIGYLAIPTLSDGYLNVINEIFSLNATEHVNTPLTEGIFEDSDLKCDWHICSDWDGYPSNMDIELAIERLLVIEHSKLRPDILLAYAAKSKMGPIPGFITTPYVIDFGVVITGSTVQCVVDIINYGPITTKLHFAKPVQSLAWLGLKICGKLNPGETGKLEVTFSPTSEDFEELEQDVETLFKIEVPYGVTIPVKVKALCAVPYLAANVTVIDFGTVRCGDKIISRISLKNVGKPTCIWYVTLKIRSPGNNSMTVVNNSGKYEPGEGGWLSIAFKPTTEMVYEGLLIFRFHMNPRKMAIPVRGVGILPQVHVIGPNVSFPPTLPWAATTTIYFGLTNPCPFPLELIFAHSDDKWDQEEEIYQLLYRYYNKPEEMLVPAITAGTGMHSEIVNFYIEFTERVKREVDAAAVAAKLASAKASSPTKEGRKTARSSQKPPPKHGKGSTTPGKGTQAAAVAVQKKIKSEAEIISDEIKALKDKGRDPLQECIDACDQESQSSEYESNSKGLIVFLHGSPAEEAQAQEIAYSIGMRLGLPTVNIDLCLVEALCTLFTPAKTTIMDAVNEAYESWKKAYVTKSEEDTENEEELTGESEDAFDVILKKLLAIASTKNSITPRSKTSDKKKKETASVEALGSTSMFQMDLTQELLMDFFAQPKFDRGFVIDSLTSLTFNQPATALSTILKCKHTIQNIHLILCQSDFSKWFQAYEEYLWEFEFIDESLEKVYEESEILDIVKQIEEMDDCEFDNVAPELRSIYIAHGLEARRQKYKEKRGTARCIIRRTADSKQDKSVSDRDTDLEFRVKSSESKKKITKKDDKATTKTVEYVTMLNKYNEYTKVTYENLVIIANNWIFEEGNIGSPLYGLNGQIMYTAQKKAKQKSDSHVIPITEDLPEQRGFPLTLVTCPCLQYKDALVNMFKRARIIRQALKEREIVDILKCPVQKKEFTVLLPKTMPHIHHEQPLEWYFLNETPIKKCECNQLTDLNLLDDTTQDNILNILSKWNCTCGKKVTSSSTSTSAFPVVPASATPPLTVEAVEQELYYPCPQPLHNVKSIRAPEKRIVLQPGDLVRCKYTFSPQWEGHFSVRRFVEVSGWPLSRIDIHVTGICDLPRIDSRPKKMFENFARRSNLEENVYKITYLDDLGLFEFGPIFIGANRIYEEEYTIDLKNSSLIRAIIDIEFSEDTEVFDLDKRFIILDPGCRGKLTITAAPSEVGVHQSELLFCVKDNPEIVTVVIQCSGVVPIVEILPLTKVIDYGKLLLYRREDDRFIIKNDSILPIMWKVRNADEFVEDFIIGHTSGIVARHDNQVVPVTYIACRVDVISYKQLIIDIYDAQGRGNPMVIDQLYLSAECYDVLIECAYENPADSCLNYGNVKVNSTDTRHMYMVNRGKYNIYYKLKKVKNFPEPSLLKTFEVVQECGVIPCSLKLVSIEFTCTPTTSMNLVGVPVYTCSLLDGSNKQAIVAKFPICITIASFYNTFTLFPLGELNFNIIAIGSGIIKDVILNNTSKCPVTFEIVVPEQYRIPEGQLPAKANNKIKNPPIKCGNFLIINADNLIAPGTSRTIQIQFYASGPGMFTETIKFIISDTCPAEANGVPFKLVGIGAMPTLDFWNIENTFREHLIVKNLADYKVPETSPHCIFVENSVTLHFFCVIVNTKFTGSIDLYNNGLVACALSMGLQNQNKANNKIFSLDKYQTHIEPLQHKNVRITFSPKELTEYRAVLVIELNLLNNQKQSFKVCLIGEGVVPRIKMLRPKIIQYTYSQLVLPMTCLGSVSSKEIQLTNICSVKSVVVLNIKQDKSYDSRHVFWLTAAEDSEQYIINRRQDEYYSKLKIGLKPTEVATIIVNYNPVNKGKTNSEIHIKIINNPYEYFTVFCEAEGFMEDVILIGLEMLSMDSELTATESAISPTDSKKKQAKDDKKRPGKSADAIKKKNRSYAGSSMGFSSDAACLKYLLDYGGCELNCTHKKAVVMVNNSDKVYRFAWGEVPYLIVKPMVGYISPGEEKDLEIMFFSAEPIIIKKEPLQCNLVAVNDDSLMLATKGATWDSRQTATTFETIRDTFTVRRVEKVLDEQTIASSDMPIGFIKMTIWYSALTEYTKFKHTLNEHINLKDTYIYQKRKFHFKVTNCSKGSMKVSWTFQIDEDFPATIDRKKIGKRAEKSQSAETDGSTEHQESEAPSAPGVTEEPSKDTLFSGSVGRISVDTWFEINLPFTIDPPKACLKHSQTQEFTVTFAPLDAFDYKVLLRSTIDNLDPCDQNIFCKISAKSLIPYCHLDIEESDYLTSGRRKDIGLALPEFVTVLEFNVLGSGCYKKSFNVINPTSEGYECTFEMVTTDKAELVPVHCNMMKAYVEGGTSCEVTFTFAPSAPGVYESMWKFTILANGLTIDLLVVGLVREPDVVFIPTILIVRNSLVGFTMTEMLKLKNNENEALKFEFKGNTLLNESGKTPVVMEPESGILKPRTETPIKFIYTPIHDGPLSFKIFCSITYMTKFMTLCVNALSYSINPKVTYFLIGNEHVLESKALTNIHLDQTASTYERTLTFIIKNNGSATFLYEWNYNTSRVKKYLTVEMEPRSGHVAPASQVECILHFTLKAVPVQAFPVTLYIHNGPEYNILLHSEIEKPSYKFSAQDFDFGKCIVNAPDTTYMKVLTFGNHDYVPILLALDFVTLPELLVDYSPVPTIAPKGEVKVKIYFRPKQVKEYEFKIKFWVNSLCEEIITVKGEGVKCLFDLYEGCEKSFDMGPVKVGSKIVRQIEVMNHSKVAIDASFIFKEMYPVIDDTLNSEATSVCLELEHRAAISTTSQTEPSRTKMVKNYDDDKVRNQIAMDIENALSSLKVVPKECRILPYRKVPLKIQFKPMGLISDLNVQLNMKVLNIERPLVRLSGSATGMSLCLSQDSLQFGRVRVRGCKILKVMLLNKGDFGARFWWQPLISPEFEISPMNGHIAARTNVTFTITYRPKSHNPFVKIWASCNIENYAPQELAMYAACMDTGDVMAKIQYVECPVRGVQTILIPVTNPTDGLWLVLSELQLGPGPFSTLTEFKIKPNSVFDIPIYFKPRIMGRHEGQLLYTNLGEGALFVTLLGIATPPNPNGTITINIEAKKVHTQELKVFHITENAKRYGHTVCIVTFDQPLYAKAREMVSAAPEGSEVSKIIIRLGGFHLLMSFLGAIGHIMQGSGMKEVLAEIYASPESYVVSTEIMKITPEKFDGYYEIKHPETVKVWGETFATCRWDFTCYADCELQMKVVFVNTDTREYQFYEIMATVTPSEILDTVIITSHARETVQRDMIVKNPLAEPATFCVHSEHLECPIAIDVERQSQVPFVISYSPLVVGQKEEYLEITNDLVGSYVYKIILKCLPAKEKYLEIKTPIGTRQLMRLRINNKSEFMATFTATVSHPSITAESEYYNLGPGETGKFIVWFEPTVIGVQNCKVSIDSAVAGEFVYNIKGTATASKPQGPYEIKAGGFTTITFKNVFMELRTFSVTVDRPEFSLKSSFETIPSKSEATVMVYLDEQKSEPAATGCLTIQCIDPPERNASWTYFLQGIP